MILQMFRTMLTDNAELSDEKTIMMIEIKNEILPRVTEQNIHNEEKMWHVKLPSDYYQFLLRTNGGVPKKCEFKLNNHVYAIKSFLCIQEDTENSKFGSYDIDVVLSQIEERLTDNEDLVGCELLPIAEILSEPIAAEPDEKILVPAHTKRKAKRGSKLDALLVETIYYEIPEADRVCEICSSVLTEMKKELLENVTLCGCLVRAKRKFHEAWKFNSLF